MYLWIICAENLLWFIVEIQVEILLSPAQLCLCCPAAGWDRSADLFDSKEFAIPENGRLPKLICSGNYQDQLEITWKKAASTEFLLLKTCRKPLMAFLWISLASVLQWFFPRGLIFFFTLTSTVWRCHLGRRGGFPAFVWEFWLAQHPETMEMLLGEEGYPSAPIPKSDSLVCGFHRWSVFLLCTWCAQDVWLTMQNQHTHSYSPDILSPWGAHCTEDCKSISVKKIHLS